MDSIHRFQIELTKEEVSSIEHLSRLAGCRTKKDLIQNALTVFKWAANEVLKGRMVCSATSAMTEVRQFDMPALAAVAEAGSQMLSVEEIRRRLESPAHPYVDLLTRLKSEESNGQPSRQDYVGAGT